MKRISPLLLTLAFAPLAACATHDATAPADTQITAASTDTTETTPARRSADGHSKDAFFSKYDVNGDGHVTQAEFMAERANGYHRRDANGDGNVQSEEYVSEYEIRLIEQLEEQHNETQKLLEASQEEVQQWSERCSSLQLANSMLGSDQHKRETKLKINAMIREIDACIAQLAD